MLDGNEHDTVTMQYEGMEQDGTVVAKTSQLMAEYGHSRSQLMVLNMRRFALHDVIALLKDRLQKAQSGTLTEADLVQKQRGMRVLVERTSCAAHSRGGEASGHQVRQ